MTDVTEVVVDEELEQEPEVDMSEEEREELESLIHVEKEIQATYRVEIYFGTDKSSRHHFFGTVTMWKKGSGEAAYKASDELVYFCPKCRIPILADAYIRVPSQGSGVSLGVLSGVCYQCGRTWPFGNLLAGIAAKLEVRGWAALITSFARIVDGDVDLLMKKHRSDITPILQKQKDNPGSYKVDKELLSQGTDYEMVVYPLSRIINDVGVGSTLEARVRAFLTA